MKSHHEGLKLYTKLTAVDMDKLNKYTEMENVKEILIEFKEYFNNLNDTFITESNINRFIMQSKYRPREPEGAEPAPELLPGPLLQGHADGHGVSAVARSRLSPPSSL